MAMGMGLQAWKVRAALEKRGIDPEAVDVEAHLDDALGFSENLGNLTETLGLRLSAKDEEDTWRRWEWEDKQRGLEEDSVQLALPSPEPVAPPVFEAWPIVRPVSSSETMRRVLSRVYRLRAPQCCHVGCVGVPAFYAVVLPGKRGAIQVFCFCDAHGEKAPKRFQLFAADGFTPGGAWGA